MTDNDVIKALECCYKATCKDCPYEINCIKYMVKDALCLIKRQNAENERLQIENESLRSAENSLKMRLKKAKEEING